MSIGTSLDQIVNYVVKKCIQKFDLRVRFITLLIAQFLRVCTCDSTSLPKGAALINDSTAKFLSSDLQNI